MKVKVEFTIETEDYGSIEFEKEIKKLVNDIDSNSKVFKFLMSRVSEIKK